MQNSCADELAYFIRAGPPGIERLRQCFKNIKKQYCGDDEEAWRESCKAAFDDNTAKLLEKKEWTLNDLDPEDFE